jgi:hypothetical protein
LSTFKKIRKGYEGTRFTFVFQKNQVFGVCQISIFIFPDQTGTATSSPSDNAASQSDKALGLEEKGETKK